jgi:hypothetical protein
MLRQTWTMVQSVYTVSSSSILATSTALSSLCCTDDCASAVAHTDSKYHVFAMHHNLYRCLAECGEVSRAEKAFTTAITQSHTR